MIPGPRVLCLGSAACMHEDLAAAAALGVVPGPDWVLVAVNHAGREWPGELDHWCSYHAELLPKWAMERQRAGRPPAGQLWTAEHRVTPRGTEFARGPNWAGSSGLLAVSIAVQCLGARQVVLAGIPLDHEQGHFDSERLWRDATNYRRSWVMHTGEMAEVRSLSGWTRDLLGEPTKEWIDGGCRALEKLVGARRARRPRGQRDKGADPAPA